MSSKAKPKSILKRQKKSHSSSVSKLSTKRPRNANVSTSISFNSVQRTHVFDSNLTPKAKKSKYGDLKKFHKEEDYDSDDMFDSIASSGRQNFHYNVRKGKDEDDHDSEEDDEFSKTKRHLLAKREKLKEVDILDEDNKFMSSKKSGDFFKGEEAPSSEFSLLHEKNSYSSNDFDENGNLKNKLKSQMETNSIPIEPFNMVNEREGGGGYFDGDTYVFRKSRGDEEDDEWIDNLEDENFHNTNVKKPSILNKTIDKETLDKKDIFQRLHNLLSNDEETVELAIQRYGREKRAIKKRTKKYLDEKSIVSLKSIELSLNQVIDYANTLLMMDDGNTDIYQYTKHRISSILSLTLTTSQSSETQKLHVESNATTCSYFKDSSELSEKTEETMNYNISNDIWEWEYRGNEDNEIHGPYSTAQMLAWIQAGYFVKENAVDVRKKKKINVEENKEEEDVNDLMEDLLDDEDEEEDEWVKSDSLDFSGFL